MKDEDIQELIRLNNEMFSRIKDAAYDSFLSTCRFLREKHNEKSGHVEFNTQEELRCDDEEKDQEGQDYGETLLANLAATVPKALRSFYIDGMAARISKKANKLADPRPESPDQ